MHQNKLGTDKKIKLFMKNNAFRVSQKFALKRMEKVMKNSNIKIVKKKDGKKIIFNLIYGMYGKIIFWEGTLAKALQMRGHDVSSLICGNTLTMCTTEYTVNSAHDDMTCKHCVDFSKSFLNTASLPYSTYGDHISNPEIDNIKNRVDKLSIDECENLTYKGVNVGGLSKNSVIRYFKGSLKPDKDRYDFVLRSELLNAIISTDVAEKIVKEEKPDILVTRHLGYSSWGSFAEYCGNKGIRVCSPGEGYKKNTLRFDIFDIGEVSNAFTRYYEEVRKKKPLNDDEEIEIQSFLDKRMAGVEGDTADYIFTPGEMEIGLFDFDKYDKTYAIFPNVPWDSSLLNANKGFNGVHDWISETIGLFKEKPNCQLLVKIHPSELRVLKSENTVSDYISNKFDSLPENIKIIPPDTKISPYDLFQFIDAGIVYNGTIGLEMALNNIPVALAGRTHYAGKGFTYDISTKKEYKDVLFGDFPSLDKQKLQLAKIYAYYFFIKSFIPYDFVTANRRTLKYGWNIKSLDDLAEGKDKYLDHICDYITKGIVYQDW